MRRSLAVILAATALFALGPLAHARRAAIIGFSADGVPKDVREQFETIVEEGLRKVGYDVVNHSAVVESVTRNELAEGCTFGPCAVAITRSVDADRAIDASIAAEGQSYTFVISMLDGGSGAPIAQVVGSCPVCTVSEVLTKVGASIGVLEGNQKNLERPELVAREAPRRRRSKVLPVVLTVAGVAAAAGGAFLVARTAHDAPGWVTIGSGGTVALTGLILLVGD